MPANANHTLTDALLRANRSGDVLSASDFVAPVTIKAAIQAQDVVIAALDQPVAGWKLGYAPDGAPVAGAMLGSTLMASAAVWRLPASGAVLVEVEIAFRLAQDLPARPQQVYRRAEIYAAVAQTLIGVELLRSRFAEPQPAFSLWLADRLGNAGYVTGDGVAPDPALDLDALPCRVWRDGALVHDKQGGHPHRDPLLPLLAYANGPGGLRAGQVITTGSLITPIRIDAPCELAAEISGIGRVHLRLAR